MCYSAGSSSSQLTSASVELQVDEDDYDFYDENQGVEQEEETHHFLEGHTALKFLLAGGVAGAGKNHQIKSNSRF